MSELKPKRSAVLLMGPTGSGKSDLAVRLAEELPLEIISVDSALVYRGMDIGTAKPSSSTRARIAHHLIDIRDAAERYSAGEFLLDARRAMLEIWARGRQPLLVGGTMLYFHALSAGMADLPEANISVRAEIDALAAKQGWAAVHRELAAVDPEAAARIHNNDPQRIQRALEVHRLTGETITKLQQARVSVFADVNVMEFALAPLERAELHTKIELRFKAMLEAGFVEEVQGLVRKRRSEPGTSIHACGRISAGMAIFDGTMHVECSRKRGDCGDATTRQAAIDLAASARQCAVVGFHASGRGTHDY